MTADCTHALVYCDGIDPKNRGYSAHRCDSAGVATEPSEAVGATIGGRSFAEGPTPPQRVIREVRKLLHISRGSRIVWTYQPIDHGRWLAEIT